MNHDEDFTLGDKFPLADMKVCHKKALHLIPWSSMLGFPNPCCEVVSQTWYVLSQDFLNRIRAQGQRWVPILDPPIHIRKGYEPYDSGIKEDIFMKDISGKPYVGQVRKRRL